MNSFKRVVAIILCFCFVVLYSSSFQVDASVDKGYVRMVKSYLKNRSLETKYYKKDWTGVVNYGDGLIDSTFNNGTLFIYPVNSTKKTKSAYKDVLNKWALYINNKTTRSISIKKISKNTSRVITNGDGFWQVIVIKKDTNKHRVFEHIRNYSYKKHIKRRFKKQLKLINKLNSW